MSKKNNGLIISICLILCTAGIVEDDTYSLVLIGIAAIIALGLSYEVLCTHLKR